MLLKEPRLCGSDGDVFSFAELFGGQTATDRVRGQQMPKQGPTLDYLGEPDAYFSSCRSDQFLRGSIYVRELDCE